MFQYTVAPCSDFLLCRSFIHKCSSHTIYSSRQKWHFTKEFYFPLFPSFGNSQSGVSFWAVWLANGDLAYCSKIIQQSIFADTEFWSLSMQHVKTLKYFKVPWRKEYIYFSIMQCQMYYLLYLTEMYSNKLIMVIKKKPFIGKCLLLTSF